jgi:hypothetical protein
MTYKLARFLVAYQVKSFFIQIWNYHLLYYLYKITHAMSMGYNRSCLLLMDIKFCARNLKVYDIATYVFKNT